MGSPQFYTIDSDSKQFPAAIRQRMAANLADPGTPEGAALAEALPAGDSSTLRRFHKALGVRDEAPATVLFVGDSWVEGSGSTITVGQRIIDRFAKGLAQRFAPGFLVGGYLPSQWGAQADTMSAPPAALSKPLPIESTYGLGRRNSVMSDASTVTWTVTGRYARLYYLQFPGQGTFDLLVDGTKVATVNTAGTGNGAAFYPLDMTTDASHTVQVSWASGGVRPLGIKYWASTSRLHVLDGGHAGSFTSDFIGSPAANHWAAAATMKPDLIVLCTGLNTFYQLGIDHFASDFAQLLTDAATAVPTAALMVLAEAFPKNGESGAAGGNWKNFVAIQRAAASAAGAAFLDLGTRLPDFNADTDGLWQSEGVHLNKYGQGIAGDITADFVSPH